MTEITNSSSCGRLTVNDFLLHHRLKHGAGIANKQEDS
jgi:hypothetical protein